MIYHDNMAMISTLSKFMLMVIIVHLTWGADAFVTEVQTVPTVSLEAGSRGKLTCGYNRTVYAVYWRYENNKSPIKLLVALDDHYQVGKRSGPGYEEGRFDITDDYSLVIHNVRAQDGGRYICEVSDFQTGKVFGNHTNVTTIVKAHHPYVRIGQCEDDVSADDKHEPCVLHTLIEDSSIELTCSVVGAKPVVDLSWTASGQWNQAMNGSILKTVGRDDGTFEQSLTVIIDTSKSKFDLHRFTCVAKGLAVDGIANHTITVYLTHGVDATLAVVLSVVCTLLFTLVIIGMVWKGITKCRSSNVSLEEKKRKINAIHANEPVFLGIFGDQGAGKSSFVKSLICAVKGEEKALIDDPSAECMFNNDTWSNTSFICKGIGIREIEDKESFDPERLPAVLKSTDTEEQSSGRAPLMMNVDQIHYPIFVFDIRPEREANEFDTRLYTLKQFLGAVHGHIMQYPMLVLTKAAAKDPEEDKQIEQLIKKIGIPRGNILVTVKYRRGESESDLQTRDKLLDFILKCVDKIDSLKRDIKTPVKETNV